MRHKPYIVLGLLTAALLLFAACRREEPILADQSGRSWIAHKDVADRVQNKFSELESYQARFSISTTEGSRGAQMSGRIFYQKPGRIRYEFDQPAGNLIVSDGRIMWTYIRRLNAVGKQELDLQRNNQNDKPVFESDVVTGLSRLFRKYHYHFDTPEQPRSVDGKNYFVLDLEQREKIGGFERMRLFVDPESYLIQRAEGADGYGKKSVITFSDIQLNPQIPGSLFQYEPAEGVRVVPNPLVREEQ
ncbi:MAG: outer membrane lipoprotein carrier protein LolA [Leptospirales bacterium]|nr:outer membrane lipoprotein carrier protein LolA [Leptospirales bacterium]